MSKNGRRIAALTMSAAMMAAAVTASGAYTSAFAQEGAQEESVSLAIAGAEDAVEEQTETEVQTEEKETEKKVDYETLETTKTGEDVVSAVDVSKVVENAMPSIVSITAKSIQEVEDIFYGRREYEAEGAGSGIIIAQNSTELLIATNNHVVEDTTEMTVCFTVDAEDPEELIVPAVVKGTSMRYDLAVVAVNLEDIPADVYKQLKIATLGSSDQLKVGETAIVIGNALGIGQTVTTGIISALEREITTEAGTFTEFQTDAAINLGCSGGAILNARGEVIGITSAKATADYAESMGYGIPVDTAIPVLQELINRETRDEVENHGYLGVTVVPVSEEARNMYDMPAGAFVYEVTEGSAAEDAGIHKGDIITRFDGAEVDSSTTLVKLIGYYEAGETVTVELQVAEGGTYVTKEVEVTLQEGSSDEEEEEPAPAEEEKSKDDQQNQQIAPLDPEYDGGENYGYGYNPFGGFGDFFFGGNDFGF